MKKAPRKKYAFGGKEPITGGGGGTYKTQAEVEAANAEARRIAKKQGLLTGDDTIAARRVGDPRVQYVNPDGTPYVPLPTKTLTTKVPKGVELESDQGLFWYTDPTTGDPVDVDPSVLRTPRFRTNPNATAAVNPIGVPRAFALGGELSAGQQTTLGLAQQAPGILDALIGAFEGGGTKYGKEPLVNAAAMRGMVSPYAMGGEVGGMDMSGMDEEQMAQLQAMADENGISVEELVQMLQEQGESEDMGDMGTDEAAMQDQYAEDEMSDEQAAQQMDMEEEPEEEGPVASLFKYGGIHIKKENRGKFTAAAKRAGMGVQAYARKVLADPNASGTLKKRANFARNASKWKHAYGGETEVEPPVKKTNGRTFMGTASQFLPIYEQYLDAKDMAQGAYRGNKEQLSRGAVGMLQPFAGKAVSNSVDYLTKKIAGKKVADANEAKRTGIINMTNNERIKLFEKYGRGGYDKWIAAGSPKLAYGGRATSGIEVEGEEVVQPPGGNAREVSGPSHAQGGVDLDVPDGTKIYSDRIKIDNKTMAQRKLSRERQMNKLGKLAKANPFDKLLQGTIQRTTEVAKMEEEKDMAIQKIASANVAPPAEEVEAEDMGQGFAYGGRVRPQYQTGGYVDPNDPYAAYMSNRLGLPSTTNAPYNFGVPNMTGSPTIAPVVTPPVNSDYAGYASNWLNRTGIPRRLDKIATQGVPTRVPASTKDFTVGTPTISGRAGTPSIRYTAPAKEPSRPGDLTLGDYVGMGSSAFGAISGIMNTRANARGNRPNVNRWQGFGREAIEANEKAQDVASGLRTSALTDIDTAAQASRNRARNSAQSVNTIRAMDTLTESGAGKARGAATNAFTTQMMNLLGQKAQLENVQDTRVMMGEDKRDLEDKGDRDNYYSNMARNLADISTTGQAMGRNLNISRSNMVDATLLGQLSEYFEYDNEGRVINKRNRT